MIQIFTNIKRAVLFLTCSVLAFICGTASALSEDDMTSVDVLASSSMMEVMTEISRHYSVKENITISTAFDSPAILAEAVEAGEPGDVLIIEDAELIKTMKRKGLIDVFRLTTIASNSLIFAVPSKSHLAKVFSNKMPLAELFKDINERTLLTVADPLSVSAGKFAKETLVKSGYWDDVEPFIVRAASSSEAAYLVENGSSAGILYRTDAHNNNDITVVTDFDGSLHSPIIYHAAIVAGENMIATRKFVDFLKSEVVHAIFQKHGFAPL